MNSIAKLLASYPDELTAVELATALACSLKEAQQIFEDGHLNARQVDGNWVVSKGSLIAQLEALRTPVHAA